MLSVDGIFYRPKAQQNAADAKAKQFQMALGDHLTMLNVYELWEKKNYSESWCQDNFLNYRSLLKAKDINNQLREMLMKAQMPIFSANGKNYRVRKAICAGFF